MNIKIENEPVDYNDTLDAWVARVCMQAYQRCVKEKERTDYLDQAIAIGINQAIRDNITILKMSIDISTKALYHARHSNDFFNHYKKQAFLKIADEIYNSTSYRCEERDLIYEKRITYSIPLFRLVAK